MASSGATPPSSTVPAMRVRIVQIDHYMLTTSRHADGSKDVREPLIRRSTKSSQLSILSVQCAPVLRVFGVTDGGQKVACHVHGVFPYMYVLWPTAPPSAPNRAAFATSLSAALHRSLSRTGPVQDEVCISGSVVSIEY